MTKRRIVNPLGSQGYHKGYHKDPIKYPILAVDQLSKTDKDIIEATVKTLTTADEAKQFVYVGKPGEKPGHAMGWQFEILDRLGNVGVIRYKGTDVAVLYKRQLSHVIPQPGDPIPEGTIKDPSDTWVRCSLIGNSARQANRFIKQAVETSTEVGRLNEMRIGLLEQQVYHYQKTITRLTKQLEAANKSLEIRKGRNPEKNRAIGWQDIIIELLPLITRLTQDATMFDPDEPNGKPARERRGLLMKVILSHGYQLIQAKEDKVIPSLHQIVGYAESEEPNGSILKVVEFGLGKKTGELIRPAKVIVAGKEPKE